MGESLGRSKGRNSKVELLRIISMWFIVAHHFVIHNAEPISVFPGTVARMVLHGVLYPSGRIAVAVFFIITVWYLADAQLTLKESAAKGLDPAGADALLQCAARPVLWRV